MKVENNKDNNTNQWNRKPKCLKAMQFIKLTKLIKKKKIEVTNIRIKNDNMAINPTNI